MNVCQALFSRSIIKSHKRFIWKKLRNFYIYVKLIYIYRYIKCTQKKIYKSLIVWYIILKILLFILLNVHT